MRTPLTLVLTALLLASANVVFAQRATYTLPEDSSGVVEVGARGDSASGDVARLERYRDLRNGAPSRIVFKKETAKHLFDVSIKNIGYRDQDYAADYEAVGKAKFEFAWQAIPLNYSYLTSTPWVEISKGVWTLDSATRLAVQNRATTGVVGVPQNAADLQAASIYRGLARPYNLQVERNNANLAGSIAATKDVTLNFGFASARKTGYQPVGASFSFNNANEIPLPLDYRTNDATAGLEYLHPRGMFRLAWNGSWFNDALQSLTWDNPLRATDTNPYDPSGYSTGNGPAQGRLATPPNNSMNSVTATGLYKMPSRTTLNASLSLTTFNQNAALIPWTSNQVILPLMPSLPRATAEAKVHSINTVLNFTSRPSRYFGLTMRYRFNDHRNLTPQFDGPQYVRFDAAPETTGGQTEQLNIKQNTFDINGNFNLPFTTLRFGYTYDDFNRTGRAFANMTDYTFRVSADSAQSRYVTVRVIYENTQRIGTGFSQDAIEGGGAQPGLRFYDEADRTRHRGTLMLIATPASMLDVTASVAAAKDRYRGPGHEFGLLDNSNYVYNAGFNVTPTAPVSFGANYGRDSYNSFQKSRNANPPPDPTFTDPARDWTLKNDEMVNNVNVYLDLIKLVKKTDIKFGYDYSGSNNAFVHGGPRVAALAAIGQFIPLPPVTNDWRRTTVDVLYMMSAKAGIGAGYWYEKLNIGDFATIDLPNAPGQPRIDYLGSIYTGYGNRPYKGSTGLLRVMYFF